MDNINLSFFYVDMSNAYPPTNPLETNWPFTVSEPQHFDPKGATSWTGCTTTRSPVTFEAESHQTTEHALTSRGGSSLAALAPGQRTAHSRAHPAPHNFWESSDRAYVYALTYNSQEPRSQRDCRCYVQGTVWNEKLQCVRSHTSSISTNTRSKTGPNSTVVLRARDSSVQVSVFLNRLTEQVLRFH